MKKKFGRLFALSKLKKGLPLSHQLCAEDLMLLFPEAYAIPLDMQDFSEMLEKEESLFDRLNHSGALDAGTFELIDSHMRAIGMIASARVDSQYAHHKRGLEILERYTAKRARYIKESQDLATKRLEKLNS